MVRVQLAGVSKKAKAEQKVRKTNQKKILAFPYQKVLAVCAALAICVGVYSYLASENLILSPFGGKTADMADSAQAPAEAAIEMRDQKSMMSITTKDAAVGAATADTEKRAGMEEAAEAAEEAMEAAKAEEAVEEAAEADTEDTGMKAAQGSDGIVASSEERTGYLEDKEAVSEELAVCGIEQEAGEDTVERELEGVKNTSSKTEAEIADESAEEHFEMLLLSNNSTDITLQFNNCYTQANVSFGSDFTLERHTGNGWSPVETKEDAAWEAVLYVLKPGRNMTEVISLEGVFGALEDGRYRLAKEYTVDTQEAFGKEQVVYTEFEIAE